MPLARQFIADFFAPGIGLVVEVDGAIHARKPVVRVSAELVLRDLAAAVALVRAAL